MSTERNSLDSNLEYDEDEIEERRIIAEAEKWESSFKNMSSEMQGLFAPLTTGFSNNTRIQLYKLLESLNWNESNTRDMYEVLFKTPLKNQVGIISFLSTLIPSRLPVFLRFYKRLNERLMLELLQRPESDVVKIIEIARFLDEIDINSMHDVMEKLSIEEVLNILDHCNEPMAKHCRLCRSRRMYALEFRMLQDDLPENMVIK